MSNRPLVTIVTPSFNQARYLGRTIDSVLSQDYPHIEYLVVDGASRDGSVAVLQSYGARFPWVSERDQGQSDAINKGFARGHGEILAYLNSDDVLLPGAVSRAIEQFGAHPDWDLLYGEADLIDEYDNYLGAYQTVDYSFDALLDACFICQPTAFWRRRIAEKVGSFRRDLHMALDYDYWLRIARAGGQIARIPERLAGARIHEATKTSRGQLRSVIECIGACVEHGGRASEHWFKHYWFLRLQHQQDRLTRIARIHPDEVLELHVWWAHRGVRSWRETAEGMLPILTELICEYQETREHLILEWLVLPVRAARRIGQLLRLTG